MNPRDESIVSELKRRIPNDILTHFRKIIVFGSRVKGQQLEDSDLDIVALIDQKNSVLEKKMEDIIYQVMWDYDFKPIISIKIFVEKQFQERFKRGFSFYKHVVNEGLAI